MKTEIDLPFIPVESAKKCGCGGHDQRPAPEEEPHSGCGCHGSPELTFASVARRFTLGGNQLLILFYILALAGIAFHAGNGLWTGASVWGRRDRSPRLWMGIAGASGALLALLGVAALLAFAG